MHFFFAFKLIILADMTFTLHLLHLFVGIATDGTQSHTSALDAGLDALFLDRKGERQGREVVGDLREAVELIDGFL